MDVCHLKLVGVEDTWPGTELMIIVYQQVGKVINEGWKIPKQIKGFSQGRKGGSVEECVYNWTKQQTKRFKNDFWKSSNNWNLEIANLVFPSKFNILFFKSSMFDTWKTEKQYNCIL